MSTPKRIITPEHFRVSSEVLGLPLASPSRRAWAMTIDLLLVAVLTKAGGSVFLGIVAAFVLFKASASKQRTSFVRSSVRLTLRVVGAVILFLVIGNGVNKLVNRAEEIVDGDDEAQPAMESEVGGDLDLNFQPSQLPALAGAFMSISRSDDTIKVKQAAQQILKTAKESGATSLQLHDARADLINMIGADRDSSDIRAVDSAIVSVAGPKPKVPAAEEVFRNYLAAVERNDTQTIQLYRDTIKAAVAGEELANQRKSIQRLEARNKKLADDLEEARKAHGIRAFISGAADDLGVGFGWSAIYFTAFWALWRGQTPGKRIAKVRVLRLDGKPMGWWLSFERFGGYAASLSVGLLGFAQILWDRNRQGLHDKATETVVVLDSAQALSRS